MDINSEIKLNNGANIPTLGLGTYENEGEDVKRAVRAALRKGYRHIDSARYYENEKEVGEAIRESGIPREEIFVTTKINNSEHDDVESSLKNSLKEFGFEYVDLLLIHWPVKQRIETWRTMEKFLKEGKVKSIGVSNFTIDKLKELMDKTEIVPAVNQVEFSPFLYQKELLKFCNENGIVLEAYSPLTRGKRLDDNSLKEIASKYEKSVPQLLIRWCLQKNIVVLPKSKTEERVNENAEVYDFSISDGDMEILDNLNEDYHTCWNPYTEADRYG